MKQPGIIVWLTGLPAAGKSTLAAAAQAELRRRGRDVRWLDSDEVRKARMPTLGFTAADRDTFYERLGDLAVETAHHCDVVLVSATAAYARYRERVRERAQCLIEVLVTAPGATLVARDPKGLYAAAREGAIAHLPGVGAPYEAPVHPDLVCDTEAMSVAEGAAAIVATIERALLAAAAQSFGEL